DYTKVLYADLLELRKNTPVVAPQINTTEPPAPPATTSQSTEEVTHTFSENKYADVPHNDIRTHIGINDKYLFLSELFGGDKVAYDAAIKHLNTPNTQAEATDWIKAQLHQKHQWDDESETVQLFYNLVNNCFPSI